MNYDALFAGYRTSLPSDKFDHLVHIKRYLQQGECAKVTVLGPVEPEYIHTIFHAGIANIRHIVVNGHNPAYEPMHDKLIVNSFESIKIAPTDMLIIDTQPLEMWNNFGFSFCKHSFQAAKYMVILKTRVNPIIQKRLQELLMEFRDKWYAVVESDQYFGMLILKRK